MAVSTIDGTLEEANLKRRYKSASLYNSIVIRRAEGGEARLGKTMMTNGLADLLTPGTSGRFYLYSTIDHKGMHGIRTADGVAVHEFPTSSERLMLFALIVSLLVVIGRLVMDGGVWLLPLGVVVMGAIAYPLYRKSRIESRRQFDADNGYAAAAEPMPEPA